MANQSLADTARYELTHKGPMKDLTRMYPGSCFGAAAYDRVQRNAFSLARRGMVTAKVGRTGWGLLWRAAGSRLVVLDVCMPGWLAGPGEPKGRVLL